MFCIFQCSGHAHHTQNFMLFNIILTRIVLNFIFQELITTIDI